MNGDDRKHRLIGSLAGCEIALCVGLPSTVEADLVVAAFSSSQPGTAGDDWLSAHDPVLGGLLGRLRSEDVFRGELCETLLISSAAPTVRAGTLMMLGLGAVQRSSDATLSRALRCVAEQASLVGGRHVAFTCGLLTDEAGLRDRQPMAAAMLAGLGAVLLSESCGVRRWTFLVGASSLSRLAGDFRVALSRLTDL